MLSCSLFRRVVHRAAIFHEGARIAAGPDFFNFFPGAEAENGRHGNTAEAGADTKASTCAKTYAEAPAALLSLHGAGIPCLQAQDGPPSGKNGIPAPGTTAAMYGACHAEDTPPSLTRLFPPACGESLPPCRSTCGPWPLPALSGGRTARRPRFSACLWA